MSKQKVIIIACILLSLILVGAITSIHYQVAPKGITVTDDFGRNVTLNGVPARIISLSPSNTEILFAIGAGDRVVGVTEYCNYPPAAKTRPKVGGVSTVSIEKVVALNPDIVIGCSINGKDTFERLEELGIPILGLNPKNISGILADIKLVGRVTGEERNATDLVAAIDSRLDAIRAKARAMRGSQQAAAPTVFYDIGGFYTAGNDTFVNEIIETAGGRNIAADKTGYFQMSIEELIAKNPQVIICDRGMGSMSKAYEEIMSDDRLKIVDAVRNNRVYLIDGDIIDRPGPRIVNAAETVYGYLSEFHNIKVKEEGPANATATATITTTPPMPLQASP